MPSTCPPRDHIALLLDGELTENQAVAVREHLDACARCRAVRDGERDLLEDLAALGVAESGADGVERVMRRLDAAPSTRFRGATWRWAGAGVAVAAVLVFAVAWWARGAAPGAGGKLQPRGAGGAGPAVAIELFVVETPPRRLEPGMRVSPGASYVARYANLERAMVHALVFGVDARGVVHWLYPAYVDPGTDPPSVGLPPATEPQVLAESVVLEGAASGPLRLVTIATTTPLWVSDIERLSVRELALPALRARFPRARVTETTIDIAEAQE